MVRIDEIEVQLGNGWADREGKASGLVYWALEETNRCMCVGWNLRILHIRGPLCPQVPHTSHAGVWASPSFPSHYFIFSSFPSYILYFFVLPFISVNSFLRFEKFKSDFFLKF
jgi:hypothetical protein